MPGKPQPKPTEFIIDDEEYENTSREQQAQPVSSFKQDLQSMLPKSHFGSSNPSKRPNKPKQTELVFGDEDDNLEVEKMMSMKPAVVIAK